jgi:hypothetical protein
VERKSLEIDEEAAELWTFTGTRDFAIWDSNPRELPRDMGPGLRPPGRSRLEEKSLAN